MVQPLFVDIPSLGTQGSTGCFFPLDPHLVPEKCLHTPVLFQEESLGSSLESLWSSKQGSDAGS